MAETWEARINAVYGSGTADDGSRGLVYVDSAGAKNSFNQQRADAYGKSLRLATSDPNVKAALAVDWWEIDRSIDSDFFLSFRMPEGSELTYEFSRDAAEHMRNVHTQLLLEDQQASEGVNLQ